MPTRSAQAEWTGDLRTGAGHMRFGGGAFDGAYSFDSRFADGKGTNPEELIAAAHAGCFTMATAGGLTRAGFKPQRLATTASVHLESEAGGFSIKRIELTINASVPGIDDATFQKIVEDAKKGCPVSRALAAVPEIVAKGTLSS
ncbi:MAG TPA: OsmC family protein [Candidatus Acidoferrales bacterium]|nr:OsmC family protein [Candidatus Acidoferrales bacterium]